MPSKRSHGEGTLRHRSDGRWELRMMDGYQKDGSPRFKTFYGKTQKEVKETRILDAEGARYACIANDYCTRCDCEEYDRILNDAAESSRKPGGITVDDLARIAEAIKAVSETDDDVPAIAFALSRRTMSHFEQA